MAFNDTANAVLRFKVVVDGADNLGRLDNSMARVAGTALKVGAGLAAAGVATTAYAVKSAAGYQDIIGHVKAFAATSDEARRQVDQMSQQILTSMPKLGITASTAAEGLYNLMSAGIQGRDAMTALKSAALAASASHTELAVTTDALTTVINAYGLKGKQIAAAQDDLTRAAALGKMEFSDLASSIGLVIPIAANAGVQTKELGAILAVMTNQGNTASEAVTTVRNAIVSLAAPTKRQREAMADLGLTMDDINVHSNGLIGTFKNIDAAIKAQGLSSQQADQLLFHLFRNNTQAARAFLGTMNDGGKAVSKALNDLQHDTGATAKAQEEAAKTATAAWNRFTATVDALMIKFGTKLLPTITKGLDSITAWLDQHGGDIERGFHSVFDPIGDFISTFFSNITTDKNLSIMGDAFGSVANAGRELGDTLQTVGEGLGFVDDSTGKTRTGAQHLADLLSNTLMLAFRGLKLAADGLAVTLGILNPAFKITFDLLNDIGGETTHNLFGDTGIGGFTADILDANPPLRTMVNLLDQIKNFAFPDLTMPSWLHDLLNPKGKNQQQMGRDIGLPSGQVMAQTPFSGTPGIPHNLATLGIRTVNATSAAAMLNPSLFYLPRGTAMNNYMNPALAANYPGGYQKAVEHAGVLVDAHGNPVSPTSHIDIPLPAHAPMRLPGGKGNTFTLLKIGIDNTGAPYEVWQDPNGKVFNYYHEDPTGATFKRLRAQMDLGRTVTRQGGTQVGSVAPYDSRHLGGQYYYGTHWHIATGPGALQDFRAMQVLMNRPSTTTTNRTRISGGRSGTDITGINPAYLPKDLRHDQLVPNIVAAARARGISPAELAAIVEFESHGDPTQTSTSGNMGLTQLSQQLVTKYGITKPYDPQQNLAGGARYLAELLKGPAHGDLFTAYGMYYAGERGFYASKRGDPGAAKWSEVRDYANRAVKAANFYSKGEIHAKTGGRRQGGLTPAQRRAQYWKYHDRMTNAVWRIKYGTNKGEQPMGAEAWRRQQMYLAMHPEADPHLKVGMGRGPNAIPWDLPLAPMDQAQVFADEYARQGESLDTRIGKLTGAAYDLYNQPSMRPAVSKYVSRIAQLRGRQRTRAENERRVNLMIDKRSGDWAAVQSDIDENIATRLTRRTAEARHDLAIGDRAGMNAAIDRVLALQGRQQRRADLDQQLQLLIARRAGDWATVIATVDQRLADQFTKASATAVHLALSGQGTSLDFNEAVQQAAQITIRQRRRADRTADVQSQIALQSGDYSARVGYLQGKNAEDLNQATAELTLRFHDMDTAVDEAIAKGRDAIMEQEAWDLAAAKATGALDLAVGRLSDFASTLDTISTQAKEAVMRDALGGATGVQQQYVDGLSAILDAQELIAESYAGLDLVIAANRTDLAGMASGIEAVTGYIERQWTNAVRQSGNVQNEYTDALRAAAAAQRDVAHASNLASIGLGMIEQDAGKVTSGLQGLVQEGTDRISFLTVALGRAGTDADRFGDNLATATTKTIAWAKNLGSLDDIISGLGGLGAQLKGYGATKFARTGQFDVANADQYRSVTEAQTTAIWDQVGHSLQLNKRAGYIDDFLSDLGDAISLQEKEVTKAAVLYGEGSTQYQTELTTLQALQKEQKDLTNAVAIATGSFERVSVSADATGDDLLKQQEAAAANQQEYDDAQTALQLFRTQGVDAATTAYTAHTGIINTSTDQFKSAMEKAASGATSLGDQATTTVGQLAALEGPISGLAGAITSAIAAINAAAMGASGTITPGAETAGGGGGGGAGTISNPYAGTDLEMFYAQGYAYGQQGGANTPPASATLGQQTAWSRGWRAGFAEHPAPPSVGNPMVPGRTGPATPPTTGVSDPAMWQNGYALGLNGNYGNTPPPAPANLTPAQQADWLAGFRSGAQDRGSASNQQPTAGGAVDLSSAAGGFGLGAVTGGGGTKPTTTKTGPVIETDTAANVSQAYYTGQNDAMNRQPPAAKPSTWSDTRYARYMAGYSEGLKQIGTGNPGTTADLGDYASFNGPPVAGPDANSPTQQLYGPSRELPPPNYMLGSPAAGALSPGAAGAWMLAGSQDIYSYYANQQPIGGLNPWTGGLWDTPSGGMPQFPGGGGTEPVAVSDQTAQDLLQAQLTELQSQHDADQRAIAALMAKQEVLMGLIHRSLDIDSSVTGFLKTDKFGSLGRTSDFPIAATRSPS